MKRENKVITLRLNEEQIESLKKLAMKNNTDVSKEIREAIDSHLNVELIESNLEYLSDFISNGISIEHKKIGNRLGGMFSKINIVTGTMHYLLVSMLSDIMPVDRYADFEEIQERAKKFGLEYANSKNDLGLQKFLSAEETKKAVNKILTGSIEE